jgi:hypothetical protein
VVRAIIAAFVIFRRAERRHPELFAGDRIARDQRFLRRAFGFSGFEGKTTIGCNRK